MGCVHSRRDGQSEQTMFSGFLRRASSFFLRRACSLSAADVMVAESLTLARRRVLSCYAGAARAWSRCAERVFAPKSSPDVSCLREASGQRCAQHLNGFSVSSTVRRGRLSERTVHLEVELELILKC